MIFWKKALDGGFDIGVDAKTNYPGQNDFVPQKLTEVYYDIDGDGEDEYLVISDPSNRNNCFSDRTRAVSVYKDGYKTYYNIFSPSDKKRTVL